MNSRVFFLFPLIAVTFLFLLGSAPFVFATTCTGTTVIQANFGNNTPGTPDTLWFNAVLDESTAPTTPGTITFTSQTITFTDPNTGSVTLNLPDSEIIFSSTATTATTTFSGGMWITTVPTGANDGNIFLSGYGYVPPAGGMSHINNPQGVFWSGTFSSTYGPSLKWQWAAASYVSFSSNPNSLNVKPIDATTGSAYLNSDHAGTPEAYATSGNVVQGGTGGGGSNWTGSYSSTQAACPLPPSHSVPEFPSFGLLVIMSIGFAVVVLLQVRTRIRIPSP